MFADAPGFHRSGIGQLAHCSECRRGVGSPGVYRKDANAKFKRHSLGVGLKQNRLSRQTFTKWPTFTPPHWEAFTPSLTSKASMRRLANYSQITIPLVRNAIPIGSGNLARQSNNENSDTQLKAWIVSHIARIMERKGLSQTKAAEIMGLKQPDLSALLNGKFSGYSAERLARCLSTLGADVRLVVNHADGSPDIFVLEAL